MEPREKVSRYVVASRTTYRHATGTRVRLVYATRTATLTAVDPETARAIEAGELERVHPRWLEALRQARVVVPAADDERAMVLARNKTATRDRSSVHIALLPTRYCNMSCAYCGQEHTRGGLSADHRGRVRERVLRAINAPTTKSARVDWFGAEPMMGYAVIKDLAPSFAGAARERGVAYTSSLVTNGSLLTVRKLDTLVNQCGVTNIEITLDGPPEIHDAHRPLKSGRGSFQTIVRTLRESLDQHDYSGTTVTFRTNVDVHNQDAIPAYIELMADLGFARPNVLFSLAPVHAWGNDVSAIEVGRQSFAAREAQWLGLLRGHGMRINVLPRRPTTVLCPAVTRSAEIISGTGNIFACSEHPLVPEAERGLALAHILDRDLPEQRPIGPFDDWNDEIGADTVGCSSCVFMPTCGGSCPKAWHEGHPPCPSYKFNFQDRLDLAASELGLAAEADVAAGAGAGAGAGLRVNGAGGAAAALDSVAAA